MMLHNKVGEIIKNNEKFAITSHVSPDGDNLGSILGLNCLLKELGKKSDVFIDDNLPERYSFLPDYNNIKKDFTSEEYDYIFVLDCGDLERTGKFNKLIGNKNIVLNIDHHISNSLFGNLNIVDTNASSTGELLYQIFKINGFNISYNTAVCLYNSIISDTGGFRYSNTTSMTHSIAGDLINTGINFTEINNMVFEKHTKSQLKLMSRVLETLEMYDDNSIAVLSLFPEMLIECGASEDEASEFVNFARDIDNVKVGVFIKEKENGICRISLRSRSDADVRLVAEAFGGGGHIRAAGCTINSNYEFAKKTIVREISKLLGVINGTN